MDVTFNFDPNCPWTWLTSRWLVRAAAEEGFDVGWGILSLAHLNRDSTDIPEHFKPLLAAGRGFHRIVVGLLDADDQDGIARLYAAYGDRRHRQGRESGRDLVVEAAEAAGVDIAGIDDESLDERYADATDALVEAAGGGVEYPVLAWEGAEGPIHVFGPIIDRVPDAAGAAALWRGVAALAEVRGFAELKRGRGEPQLSTS